LNRRYSLVQKAESKMAPVEGNKMAPVEGNTMVPVVANTMA